MHWIDPVISFSISVRVFVNRLVVERLRLQLFTDSKFCKQLGNVVGLTTIV